MSQDTSHSASPAARSAPTDSPEAHSRPAARFVHPFRDLCIADVPTVGGKVGICGEAPSNYREFAAWLADAGIDSMSLNPDALAGVARTLARTTHTTAIAERALR